MAFRIAGKVFTASVSNIKEIERFCDEIWLITRAGTDIPGTIRVRWLSPGPELYKDYLEKWKDKDPQEWWPLYRERFEEELKLPERRAALQKLLELLQKGNNVGLLCYCPDYRYCHRTIISDHLRMRGVPVEEVSRVKAKKHAKKFAEKYVQEVFDFG